MSKLTYELKDSDDAIRSACNLMAEGQRLAWDFNQWGGVSSFSIATLFRVLVAQPGMEPELLFAGIAVGINNTYPGLSNEQIDYALAMIRAELINQRPDDLASMDAAGSS